MAHDSVASRLYRGEVSYGFIQRRRRWYALSGAVILVGIVSMIVIGLNPSIDFKGGAVFQGPRNGHSLAQVASAVSSVGVTPEEQQTTGSGTQHGFRIETRTLTQVGPTSQVARVEDALVSKLGISRNSIDVQTVGSTWGGQITQKAILGLVVFLVAVVIYMTVRFEWKMALAAIIALVHDLVITAGIYALSGLEVSPSTVIALLTILGYSLYDTVVVFDKVRENVEGITGGSRMTFSEAANLAVNQTLVRSINTSIIALLPVIGLLVIGAGFLGAGSLKDLSMALLIGLASGAYSSIFIATPLLCDLKERESVYQQLARRVAARRGSTEMRTPNLLQPATVGAPATSRPPTPPPPATSSRRDSYPAAEPSGDAFDETRYGGAAVPIDDEATGAPGDEQAAAPAARRGGPPPRPGARPARSQRRGRPGGRGGKSRKRR